jgi:hypothetical protein
VNDCQKRRRMDAAKEATKENPPIRHTQVFKGLNTAKWLPRIYRHS